MSSGKLLKFGVPIANQVAQTGKVIVPKGVRHQTGQCGIEPYKTLPPPPPAIPEKFPQHLIRPPCRPESEKGKYPPECAGLSGFYCPPNRLDYKYPPFSENINFVPSGESECWWAPSRACVPQDEEELPIKV